MIPLDAADNNIICVHQIKSTLRVRNEHLFSSVTWNKSCQNPDEAAEEIHGVCWFCTVVNSSVL